MTKLSVFAAALVAVSATLSAAQPVYAAGSTDTDHDNQFAIAIHGGAGTITRANLSDEQEAAYKAKLTEALNAGHTILAEGGTSMDAVIAAVQIMEDSPLFNSGRGAVYTFDGEHELDASIMDGKTLEAGAVAGVKTIKSPIALARKVMENSVHVMLSGEGAEQFASEQGLERVSNDYFDTEHRYQQLQQARERLGVADKQAYLDLDDKYKYGTVGAVAVDKHGNLSAATSTGGMTAKRYGRIGDSPIIGAGTWADNASCAVSATGHGEYFIRYHVAADICSRVKYLGDSVEEAGDTVIHDVLLPAGGTGGVIIVDAKGNVHMPFNTEGMYRASRVGDGETEVAIYKD
ncbi:isoaspartyl peptidase/L-asparaginase [Pseudidiomarina sp. 1APP75-27a]|uniref:isoaspartyl peptidase/L-asparaginase family protein n=1 Tax=Pseudidiomarina terrestris TaxID=2820060 RepID=UPI002B05C0F9|nr:isoaspartyl peptidase/L-asparaginase [Pseudidiomarina sp. 1APP75-27a]MEA3586948.1 isoaspartyl peptidase/L-asparaginase [Pseudidiomarina sp. 1APP75-27a]